MRHTHRRGLSLMLGAAALVAAAALAFADKGSPTIVEAAGSAEGRSDVAASTFPFRQLRPRQETTTAEPGSPEPSATAGTPSASPTDGPSATHTLAPPTPPTSLPGTATSIATATAAPRPIYLPWVDRMGAAAKQEPVYVVAGNIVRLAPGPRQLYALEDGPPRLTVLHGNTATGRLERSGSMALDAPGLDPRSVRLAADPLLDYAYLLYFNALTVVEAVNPPQPRKLLAAPDCDALAVEPWTATLGCDGLRTVDLENPEAAKELFVLPRAGRAQALAQDDGLLAAAFREAVPASRPTTLALYHTGYRQKPRPAGQLADVGNTVAMVMVGRLVYQLVDEDGRRGLQLIDVADLDGRRQPRLLARLDLDGLPRGLAVDPSAQRLYVLEEGWFDRRDRMQHGQTGVRVYSLKDPRQPRLWRFLPLDQPAADIAATEGLLYVAGGSAGLAVYRVE